MFTSDSLRSLQARILVTHLIHFLPQVNNVLTMKAGRIVEQGSYDELMEYGRPATRQLNMICRAGKAFSEFIEEHRSKKQEEEIDEAEELEVHSSVCTFLSLTRML